MVETVVIRVDANKRIGAGHFMRCRSIVDALLSIGISALFAVSDKESLEFVDSAGFEGKVTGGNYEAYDSEDAVRLKKIAEDVGASAVLVDSYAVNAPFFHHLKSDHFKTAYIDDMYVYHLGLLSSPLFFDLDIVINYGFSANLKSYRSVYSCCNAGLLIGPSFAPVRKCFADACCVVEPSVKRVLVTSGSTNPDNVLERMISSCVKSKNDVTIDVIVGKNAVIDKTSRFENNVHFHRDVEDLSEYMLSADIAVSAGGSTLYELACVGTPTIAVPIVENQIENVRGFHDLGLGMALSESDWSERDLSSLFIEMSGDSSIRIDFSERMKSVVDGSGAFRIAEALSSAQ